MEPKYKPNANPWAIFRCFEPTRQVCVARFRRRSEADGHIKTLRRMIPDASFQVVFDSQGDNQG
ncbi:hypothetical protein PI95_034610 [Hassallia byssoidea VB512170]|uniref:Uncharacterized protein n=1 Tax=Hassallia byssoidea VB512170 TaxID=1304833 RepID=A0A846HJD6_9CYAN|nr:hypothetical protein [Hassalia byssoidea]NEU77455.1 hypothetical protein [Hassalia byssoidea VB512170]